MTKARIDFTTMSLRVQPKVQNLDLDRVVSVLAMVDTELIHESNSHGLFSLKFKNWRIAKGQRLVLSVDDPLQPNFVLKIFWYDNFSNREFVYLKETGLCLSRIFGSIMD